ncbi:Gfo/Idh/MocA family protein [Wenxinia marina]|uniref:Putative dehydrogenase n=1 Tax=Wenxinia marina DSM 24838 TaxID=1123501 RepID=A0A0D0PIQ2_9RHOB|nr:Gfo/Idh/MocA family oxidoreductase [Wenxinia marina]KIQ71231.1 putative dehydrogenase [Wenxinia marina DSM 24838]GGL81442.1 dehydrogenase [Wenxinia marina]
MTVRFALLGTWHVHALDHLNWALRHEQAEVAVVWDGDETRGRAFAAAHGLPFEKSLAVALASDAIDAVIVDCETTDHPQVIGAALAAGKHVFTEKVLAVDPDDAAALARQARDAGLVLWVSLQRMGEAPHRTIRQIVAEGSIGRVVSSRIRYAHGGAFGTPPIPKGFFEFSAAGGGVMIDLGAHPAYLAMMIHGEVPVSVSAEMSSIAGLGVEDNAAYIMRFPSGAISVAEVSFVNDRFSFSIEVTGTSGMLTCGPVDTVVRLRRAGDDAWVAQPPVLASDDMLSQFINELRSPGRGDALLTLAAEVSSVIGSAYRSAEDARG